MHHIRGEVRKGFQHEPAFGHQRMGNAQTVGREDAAFVKEDVEIDGPRGPVLFAGAPELALYRFEEIEEAFRIEAGLDFEDAVEKVRLF